MEDRKIVILISPGELKALAIDAEGITEVLFVINITSNWYLRNSQLSQLYCQPISTIWFSYQVTLVK